MGNPRNSSNQLSNNFILAWSANCVTAVSTATANQGVKFAITDKKFYVPVVSTQDNAKLPQ